MVTDASSPTDHGKSAELLRLEAEKVMSQAAADVAANWAKRLSELLPSKIEAITGIAAITGDHPIECQILSYRALDKVAKEIAENIKSTCAAKVIAIHNEQDVNLQVGLRAFEFQIGLIEASLNNEINSATGILANLDAALSESTESVATLGLVPVAASTALKAAADLVSLFKLDVALTYKNWSIGDSALVSAVANYLSSGGITIFQPVVIPVGLFDSSSEFMSRMVTLLDKRARIEATQIDLTVRQAVIKAEIQKLTEDIAGAASATPQKDTKTLQVALGKKELAADALARFVSRMQLIGSTFDAFQAALLKADAVSGFNSLTGLLRAEKLRTIKGLHWLVLKSVAAGGGFKTERSLWQRTPTISYSGGFIADFTLFDGDGRIVCSNVASNYIGFCQVRNKLDATGNLTESL